MAHKNAGALIFDLDGTLYDSKYFTRRLLFSGFLSGGSGKDPVGRVVAAGSAGAGGFSLGEIRIIGAERKTRKEFAGCDYGGAETYYGHFFAALERRTRGFAPRALRGASALEGWYFNRYMPRMTAVLRALYPARPGAAELLQTLTRTGIPHAVYSDYPRVEERLDAIGLDPRVCGLLFGPEDFGAQKPAPGPFLGIAASLRCEPARTLVIGDRDDTDGAGAQAAGMMYLSAGPRIFAELSTAP
jgi:FMN phosphatase YigB (HAD superfamily)